MGKVTTDILLKNHIDVMTGVVQPRTCEIKNAIVDPEHDGQLVLDMLITEDLLGYREVK